MARLCKEDAYSLGLLYICLYSDNMRKMVKLDTLKNYHEIIEQNLEEMNSDKLDLYATLWLYKEEEPIYFTSENENGEVYCILKHNIDIYKVFSTYSNYLSTDVFEASQSDIALKCLGFDKVKKKVKIK